jgi:hypothetical protein
MGRDQKRLCRSIKLHLADCLVRAHKFMCLYSFCSHMSGRDILQQDQGQRTLGWSWNLYMSVGVTPKNKDEVNNKREVCLL